MEFFEQIGKKLTDAGQNVAQQTKDLADVDYDVKYSYQG